jgi:hypothetical protein
MTIRQLYYSSGTAHWMTSHGREGDEKGLGIESTATGPISEANHQSLSDQSPLPVPALGSRPTHARTPARSRSESPHVLSRHPRQQRRRYGASASMLLSPCAYGANPLLLRSRRQHGRWRKCSAGLVPYDAHGIGAEFNSSHARHVTTRGFSRSRLRHLSVVPIVASPPIPCCSAFNGRARPPWFSSRGPLTFAA